MNVVNLHQEPKTQTITIKITPEQKLELLQKAQKQGLNTSTLIRRKLFDLE